MTDLYAVIGNPVAHSKSPQIHAAFAAQTGQDLVYERVLGPEGRFIETVDAFRARGGRGLNVTLPFKLDAFAYAQEHSARARAAGAVNTLKFGGARVYGDNTDGVGLTRDLEVNLGVSLRDRRILVLGAGGATQGVLLPLLERGPALLTIANRTVEKAERLARDFGAHGPTAASSFDGLAGGGYDVVIDATSAAVGGEGVALPGDLYAEGALAYEMMYGKGETAFARHARACGVTRVADGLGMLVEQAAESFLLWRGVRPETAGVLAALRAGL